MFRSKLKRHSFGRFFWNVDHGIRHPDVAFQSKDTSDFYLKWDVFCCGDWTKCLSQQHNFIRVNSSQETELHSLWSIDWKHSFILQSVLLPCGTPFHNLIVSSWDPHLIKHHLLRAHLIQPVTHVRANSQTENWSMTKGDVAQYQMPTHNILPPCSCSSVPHHSSDKLVPLEFWGAFFSPIVT